jgi:hypothetical protein
MLTDAFADAVLAEAGAFLEGAAGRPRSPFQIITLAVRSSSRLSAPGRHRIPGDEALDLARPVRRRWTQQGGGHQFLAPAAAGSH